MERLNVMKIGRIACEVYCLYLFLDFMNNWQLLLVSGW